MFTQIFSRGSAIIGNAEQVLLLCGVRLELAGSRMMPLVEGAALQPVEETAGSACEGAGAFYSCRASKELKAVSACATVLLSGIG
jgi:hypothetical protein